MVPNYQYTVQHNTNIYLSNLGGTHSPVRGNSAKKNIVSLNDRVNVFSPIELLVSDRQLSIHLRYKHSYQGNRQG